MEGEIFDTKKEVMKYYNAYWVVSKTKVISLIL